MDKVKKNTTLREDAGLLDRQEIFKLLGPLPQRTKLCVKLLESTDCGTYVQEHIRYAVEQGDHATAFVLVPKQRAQPAPAIFCHHQHTGERNRIKTTVCNCGCISYKHSLTKDAGVQMEFVVQGIAEKLDIEDLVRLIAPNSILLSGTTDDKWCRGLKDIYSVTQGVFPKGAIELKVYTGSHAFTPNMRAYAYEFLDRYLQPRTKNEEPRT